MPFICWYTSYSIRIMQLNCFGVGQGRKAWVDSWVAAIPLARSKLQREQGRSSDSEVHSIKCSFPSLYSTVPVGNAEQLFNKQNEDTISLWNARLLQLVSVWPWACQPQDRDAATGFSADAQTLALLPPQNSLWARSKPHCCHHYWRVTFSGEDFW